MEYCDLIEQLTFEQIKEIISQYIKKQVLIKNNKFNTVNFFSIVNLRENNHIELLKWLLDNNRLFLEKFLTNEYLNINSLDIDINKLVTGMKVKCQYPIKYEDETTLRKGHIDILLYNEDCEFLCVSELKLDAGICLDKYGTTQIEKYYRFLHNDNKFKNYKQCYVFLCIDTETFKTKKISKVAKPKNIKPVIYGKPVVDETIEDLFTSFEYQMIEYSDIILMLYDILYNYKKTCINDFVAEIIRQYIEYWERYSKFTGGGYSDIVEVVIDNKKQYINIWSVCEKLKNKYKDKYQLLSKEEKDTVDKITVT